MPTYNRLARKQRYTIDAMHRNGSDQKEIAAAIGVHPSTISRELRRGSSQGNTYSYIERQLHADSREWKGYRVSNETIYLHVYRDKASGGDLHKHLRHPCKSYLQRGSGRERRGKHKDQVMIDERPAVVDERSRIGDWDNPLFPFPDRLSSVFSALVSYKFLFVG